MIEERKIRKISCQGTCQLKALSYTIIFFNNHRFKLSQDEYETLTTTSKLNQVNLPKSALYKTYFIVKRLSFLPRPLFYMNSEHIVLKFGSNHYGPSEVDLSGYLIAIFYVQKGN